MQRTGCGREGACAQSLIRSDSLMAVTWRKKVSKRPKMAKNQDLGGISGESGGKTQFFAFKNQKNEVFGKFGIFHLFFFLNFGRKKSCFGPKKAQFWPKNRCPNFFSRPIWGAKKFPHLYLTNFAAAIAAVTTKLTLIKNPYLARNSGAEFCARTRAFLLTM